MLMFIWVLIKLFVTQNTKKTDLQLLTMMIKKLEM